jgi:hypothetical protein
MTHHSTCAERHTTGDCSTRVESEISHTPSFLDGCFATRVRAISIVRQTGQCHRCCCCCRSHGELLAIAWQQPFVSDWLTRRQRHNDDRRERTVGDSREPVTTSGEKGRERRTSDTSIRRCRFGRTRSVSSDRTMMNSDQCERASSRCCRFELCRGTRAQLVYSSLFVVRCSITM